MSRVLVIGGPGNISASALADLVMRGHQVGLFSRPTSPFDEADPAVTIYRGDRDRPGELEAAFAAFRPDVVLDLACFLPRQAEQAVKLCREQVRHIIFASTVDVYGYPLARLPFCEDDPWQPETRSVYAANKRRCEDIFRAAGLPLTIVRPAYSFGPRFILSALNRAAASSLLYRLYHQLPVLVPGDGTTLIHASSGYNTGRMIAAMVEQSQTIGRDYTCAHPDFMTYADYVRLFARVVGREPVLVCIPSDVILALRVPEMANNLLDELTRFNVAFSIRRFVTDFPDFQFEPLEDAARRAVEWNFAQGHVTHTDVIDDHIIAAYQACLRDFAVG